MRHKLICFPNTKRPLRLFEPPTKFFTVPMTKINKVLDICVHFFSGSIRIGGRDRLVEFHSPKYGIPLVTENKTLFIVSVWSVCLIFCYILIEQRQKASKLQRKCLKTVCGWHVLLSITVFIHTQTRLGYWQYTFVVYVISKYLLSREPTYSLNAVIAQVILIGCVMYCLLSLCYKIHT